MKLAAFIKQIWIQNHPIYYAHWGTTNLWMKLVLYKYQVNIHKNEDFDSSHKR